MSQSTAIFWPVIIQALMTFSAYMVLLSRRFAAVKKGLAQPGQFRANLQEPETSQTAKNHVANQFELPVLFYVVTISLYVTGLATLYPVTLAWLFVLSRLAHAYVHLTTNRLVLRMRLFIAGFLLLCLMWVWFAVGLVTH